MLDNIGTPDKCLPDNHGGTNFLPPIVRSGPPAVFRDRARNLRTSGKPRKPTPPIAWACACRAAAGRWSTGASSSRALRAIDPTTGERRWEHRYRAYPSTVSLDLTGGILSTASGLVFTGDNDGYFQAFDAATGKALWRFQTGAPLWGAAAVTYMLDGRQWVVVPSGLLRRSRCRRRRRLRVETAAACGFPASGRRPLITSVGTPAKLPASSRPAGWSLTYTLTRPVRCRVGSEAAAGPV